MSLVCWVRCLCLLHYVLYCVLFDVLCEVGEDDFESGIKKARARFHLNITSLFCSSNNVGMCIRIQKFYDFMM